MIGGFNIVPYYFKQCDCWQERSLWVAIMVVGFFVVIIPNWYDRTLKK